MARGDEALLAVHSHHPRAVAARRLIADEPALVELLDVAPDLEVELHAHGSGREVVEAVHVVAEEARLGDDAVL